MTIRIAITWVFQFRRCPGSSEKKDARIREEFAIT